MSRFIDKLKQVSQATPRPLGFRAAPSASLKPKMQLIASLAQADSLADYVTGVDAGLLPISELSEGAEALQKISQVVTDIPWGGWLRGINQGGIKQLVKLGCDFVVFPAANTPLAAAQNDEVGRVLEVEASLSEGLLRAVNGLPVDAVLIAGEREKDYSLTWRHLMLFQHFANLLTKPLLVSIPLKVTASELQALWDAGVDGVVVEVGVGQPAKRLEELRQAIDRLRFSSRRKRGKTEVLLPYVGGEEKVITEEEEEEE